MKNRLFRSMAVLALIAPMTGCSKSKSSDAAGTPGEPNALPAGLASPLAFLNGFEGEIDIDVKKAASAHGPGENIPLSLLLKSDKVRMAIPAGLGGGAHPMNIKGYVILDTPEKKLSVVMDEQKQVMVIDLNKTGEQLKAFQPPPGAPGSPPREGPARTPPKVTKTGTTDKVAGFTCENWEVSEEGRKVAALCIADEGVSWFRLPTLGIPSDYAWAAELMDGKHFPLRAIGFEKDGSEAARVEVSKLEKKSVPSTFFDIPAGYRVVDLGTMFQQMAGMSRGMTPGGMPGGMPGSMPVGFPAMGQLPKKHK